MTIDGFRRLQQKGNAKSCYTSVYYSLLYMDTRETETDHIRNKTILVAGGLKTLTIWAGGLTD